VTARALLTAAVLACSVEGAAAQDGKIPPLTTYAAATPERAWLRSVHQWNRGDWKGLIASHGATWHALYPGGEDQDDPDDPMWAINSQYRWAKPVSMGPIRRQQLSAGIVRLFADMTLEGTGRAPGILRVGVRKRYVHRCRVIPEAGGWRLDTCNFDPKP
jgi:hypothetical protein